MRDDVVGLALESFAPKVGTSAAPLAHLSGAGALAGVDFVVTIFAIRPPMISRAMIAIIQVTNLNFELACDFFSSQVLDFFIFGFSKSFHRRSSLFSSPP